MKKLISYLYYDIYSYRLMKAFQSLRNKMGYETNPKSIAGKIKRQWMYIPEGTELIRESIEDNNPFFAGRIGASELNLMRNLDFGSESDISKAIHQLCLWSGFFPDDRKDINNFYETMKEALGKADLIGMWSLEMEDYYVNRFTSDSCIVSHINLFDPKTNPFNPWISALEGKRVLVVHPFTDSIRKQYEEKRQLLFNNENMLPKFELHTIKAVQTIAGQKDNRFDSWFDALDYMKCEIVNCDFDVALIGCGAYGFPLGAFVKDIGKKAIHAGGILQTYFGITGNRWTEDPTGRIARYTNEHWIFPSEEETPIGASVVEDDAYWNGKGIINGGNWKL